MHRPVRILVVGMSSNRGGVESVIINYYRRFDKDKIRLDFLSNEEHIAFEEELRSYGSKMYYVPAKRSGLKKYKKALNNFFRLHASEYDVIWCNQLQLANIDYLKLAKEYGIRRRIIHSHNSRSGYVGLAKIVRDCIHGINRQMVVNYATDFWACSQTAAEYFYPKSVMNKVKIINNAIDIHSVEFNESKRDEIRKQYKIEDDLVIGNVGRLHMQKNQTFMLDIMAEVVKFKPNAKLLLVGDGSDKDMLVSKMAELGLQNRCVIFAGMQSDIQAYLSAFDVFLFPSLFEGLSVAALEGQANGVPFLASSNGNVPEIKINSNFSFVDLNDGAKHWADVVLEVAQQDNRLKEDEIEASFDRASFNIEKESLKLEKELSKKYK
ncbi:hypothetical protein BTI50_06120 [Lactobacillus delbrueckii subsp. bulgaricus]|nr:hypothetical protein [Lactobacillus delbrueckii subsp. bulgaricus]